MRQDKGKIIQALKLMAFYFKKSLKSSCNGIQNNIDSLPSIRGALLVLQEVVGCYLCSSAFTSGLIITAKPDGLCLNFLLFLLSPLQLGMKMFDYNRKKGAKRR